MKTSKIRARKVGSFGKALHKTLAFMDEALAASGESSYSAPKIGINKRIIILKIDTGEIVQLINPVINKEGIDETTGYKALSITYQNKIGESEDALLTEAEAYRFYAEYGLLNNYTDQEEEECEHDMVVEHGLVDSYQKCSKCHMSEK